MRNFWGLMVLVVGGVIVADFLIHPAGTQALASGATGFAKTTYSGLLGKG